MENERNYIYVNKWLWIFFLVLTVVLFIYGLYFMYQNYKLEQDNYFLNSQIETFKMTDKEIYEKIYQGNNTLRGLYYGDFFAVWVKDRSWSEVMETCSHEYLHYVYYYNWTHFDADNNVHMIQ